MSGPAGQFVRVIIPSPLKHPLTYRVPPEFQEQIAVGARVLIPLGRRKVTGIVLELLADGFVQDAKDILSLQDERPAFDPDLLQLIHWAAQYYLAPLGEIVATVLPPSLRVEGQRTVLIKNELLAPTGTLENQVIEILRQNNGQLGLKSLARKISRSGVSGAVERLHSAGAVEIRERVTGKRRRSKDLTFSTDNGDEAPELVPTEEQERALKFIQTRLGTGGFETFLLHGVTGSGKTAIYLRAMEQVRETNRQSLILIPEISLTPQLLDRVHARFPGRTGVLHSGLSGAERWTQWWRIRNGQVDAVVGARSAVFAPLPNLGLIIVDEEHDTSYKQEEGLRYNARDIAIVRGKILGCPVILGSATPAIETYENCLQGRYRLLELTRRVNERPLPVIEPIDLRSRAVLTAQPLRQATNQRLLQHKRSGPVLLSDQFIEALRSNQRQGNQTLVFLNRRGFANFLQCSLCGYVLRCPACSVTLTFHREKKSLRCHHCGYGRSATHVCPQCRNETLSGVGVGTEQIEDELRRLLPQARIARMDRDTTTRRGSHEHLIRRWEKGAIDILIGTQMITKGHDVSGVTLVAALLADHSLNFPDFRAAERTFQMLTQVAGRAGRGNIPGRVLIQTFAADHYVIRHLMKHDYRGFFAEEIEYRRALNYPPFSRLVNLRIEGPRADEVEKKAKFLAASLRQRLSRNSELHGKVEILGAAPAPLQKLRNRFRWQILLKGKQFSALQDLATAARALVPRSRAVRLHIDVDPYNML